MSLKPNIDTIALIGFDITEGPVLRWKKDFNNINKINIEQLYTNFYVMFKGGGKFKPKAVIFDDFQIVAFSNQMDLLCVFLNNKINMENLSKIKEIANKVSIQFTNTNIKELNDIEEKILNLLRKHSKLTIKQIEEHISLSYHDVWKTLITLEMDGKAIRNKENREHLWTIK